MHLFVALCELPVTVCFTRCRTREAESLVPVEILLLLVVFPVEARCQSERGADISVEQITCVLYCIYLFSTAVLSVLSRIFASFPWVTSITPLATASHHRQHKMGKLMQILQHPDEIIPLVRKSAGNFSYSDKGKPVSALNAIAYYFTGQNVRGFQESRTASSGP